MKNYELYKNIIDEIFEPVEGMLLDEDNYILKTGAESYINGRYYCLTEALFDEFKENTELESIVFVRLRFIVSENPFRFEYKEEIDIAFNWTEIDKEYDNFDSMFYLFFSKDLRSIFFSFREGWALVLHK